jgi:hypothetical protein
LIPSFWQGAVNIPFKNAKRVRSEACPEVLRIIHDPTHFPLQVFNPELNKKEFIKSDNPDFIKQFQRKFPAKDSLLLIGCSDGRSYSMDALEALDEAGYTHIVGMKGGYYSWYKVFDNNLRRRRGDGYTEKYDGEGSDSCGIHASGAGFER